MDPNTTTKQDFNPVKKFKTSKKAKKAKEIQDQNQTTLVDGHSFKNYTGTQKAYNMLEFMRVLTSNQISGARFSSFFNILEISYYMYTMSFPCLYFLLQRYTLRKPLTQIYGLIDKFGEDQTSIDDHKHFLVFLNFGSFLLPILFALVLMLVLILLIGCCGKKYITKSIGIGCASHIIFKYLLLSISCFFNIHFLILRNSAQIIEQGDYDFMVNSYLITTSFCQILLIFEQLVAVFLVQSVLSDHLYHRDKMAYIVDVAEIDEIKKEVYLVGLKSKRDWRELNEQDILQLGQIKNNEQNTQLLTQLAHDGDMDKAGVKQIELQKLSKFN